MKKGFTIIELIAVVTIIAVLIAVAFLMLSGSINSAKVKAYNQNIEKVIETTELYIANGNLDSPLAVGDTAEVTVEELITAGYLKAIKSPFDKSKTCNGYVLIEKTTDDEYLYNPYLNCAADIGNSTEDGLALHYTFDDFQEPTMNYLAYASSLSASNWSSYGFGDSYVNTQITTSSEGYLNSNSIKVNRLTTHTYMTAATSYKSSAIVMLPGEKITASAYIRAGSSGVVGKTLQIHIYGLKTGGGNFSLGVDTAPLTSEWIRYEYILTNTDAVNWTVANIYFRLNCGTSLLAGEHYYISSPQIEKKGYSTPFVDGSRTGVVKDYSGNDNNSNLLINDTPTWLYDHINLNGYYDFDTYSKISTQMKMNNTNYGLNDATYTFSMWMKLKKHNLNGISVVFGMAYYDGFGIHISSDGSTYTKVSTYYRGGSSQYQTNEYSINVGEWYNIISILDKTRGKILIYINGTLFSTTNISSVPFVRVDYAFSINNQNQPGGNGPWNNIDGYIDDVRIYNRVLNADELKMMYTLSKDKYD